MCFVGAFYIFCWGGKHAFSKLGNTLSTNKTHGKCEYYNITIILFTEKENCESANVKNFI